MDEKPTDCKYSRWEGESIKSLKCILTNTLCDPRICPKVQEKETVEKVLESKVEVEKSAENLVDGLFKGLYRLSGGFCRSCGKRMSYEDFMGGGQGLCSGCFEELEQFYMEKSKERDSGE